MQGAFVQVVATGTHRNYMLLSNLRFQGSRFTTVGFSLLMADGDFLPFVCHSWIVDEIFPATLCSVLLLNALCKWQHPLKRKFGCQFLDSPFTGCICYCLGSALEGISFYISWNLGLVASWYLWCEVCSTYDLLPS